MKARGLTKETILDLGRIDSKLPAFRVGDTIEVGQTIKEGDKERVQLFEGDIISMHQKGISSTFTIRRIGANGVGVEKIFPFNSPLISHIRVVKHGMVRRSKLYYIRERLGRSARIKERILTREQKEAARAQAAK